MTTLTRAEVARLIGRDKSHVTRLGQADRLVFASPGLVDVEASLARIEATRGNRYDVEARWDDVRAQAPEAQAPGAPETALETPTETQAEPSESAQVPVDEVGRRTRHAQMLKAEAEARAKEREDLVAAGALVPKAEVERDLMAAVGVILNAGEGLPDRVAPLLVDQGDQGTITAILRDEWGQFLAQVSEQLGAIAAQEVAP